MLIRYLAQALPEDTRDVASMEVFDGICEICRRHDVEPPREDGHPEADSIRLMEDFRLKLEGRDDE